jgi:hypothetical protein
MELKRSCICRLGEAATRQKYVQKEAGARQKYVQKEAGARQKYVQKEPSLSQSRPPILCRRWKPEAAKSTSKRRPAKSTSKKRLEPARIMSKGSPTCRKAGHLYYAGGRKKAAGMEPKRSCICRLGEAAGIALSPKTTS